MMDWSPHTTGFAGSRPMREAGRSSFSSLCKYAASSRGDSGGGLGSATWIADTVGSPELIFIVARWFWRKPVTPNNKPSSAPHRPIQP
ncbi:MAG: hypothetical protein WDN30_03465 [Pararobbsia sp.]